jgi:hypothetical protein
MPGAKPDGILWISRRGLTSYKNSYALWYGLWCRQRLHQRWQPFTVGSRGMVNPINDDYKWGMLLLRKKRRKAQHMVPGMIGCDEMIPDRYSQLK